MTNKTFPRPYKFHIKKSKNGQFYGVLTAPNGEPMDTTETMLRKRSVLKNFERKQKAYATAVVVDDSVVIKKKTPLKKSK
jgi:uncharacterized protein YegP (UPF0339 family)